MEEIKKKEFSFRLLLPYLVFCLVIIVIDQLTKYWAQTKLQPKGFIDVIDGVFSLTYVRNTGAAFGILQGQKWLLLVLTLVVLIGAVWYLIHSKTTNPVLLASGSAVLSGAVGNLIDRIRLSYVIDFLEIRFIHFPVFNVADCCVVVGMIVLGICILRGKTQ